MLNNPILREAHNRLIGKTVLVTGATGLIGGSLVRALMNKGNADVIALSRGEAKLKEIFSQYANNNIGIDADINVDKHVDKDVDKDENKSVSKNSGTFRYIAKDVAENFDLASISPNRPIDLIFHAASPISGKVVSERPVDVIKPNITAMSSLMEGLVKQRDRTGVNGRIVIFSSATVYGVNSENDVTVTEADTRCADPLDSAGAAYSESKRMAEVMARAYVKQYGIDAVIARIGWVYGPAKYPPETAFYEFVNNALNGEDIKFKSSGFARRDNIYIDDVISGLLVVADKGISGESYNISSGGQLSNFAAIDEIAEVIAQVANKEIAGATSCRPPVKVIFESGKIQTRKPGPIMDNGKLETLGWKLGYSLYDGVKQTLSNMTRGPYL